MPSATRWQTVLQMASLCYTKRHKPFSVHLPKYTLKGTQYKKEKSLLSESGFSPFLSRALSFPLFPLNSVPIPMRERQGDKPNSVQATEKALAFSSAQGRLFSSCLGVRQAVRVAFAAASVLGWRCGGGRFGLATSFWLAFGCLLPFWFCVCSVAVGNRQHKSTANVNGKPSLVW